MVGSDWGRMPLKGTHHSAADREKIARRTAAALARKRARERIAPSEVLELERHGTISRNLRPFAIQAAQESHDLAEALGGVDAISEQRRVLIADCGRLGLVLRAMLARFLQGADADPERSARGSRRSSASAARRCKSSASIASSAMHSTSAPTSRARRRRP